jgi:hypothetical protein
MKVVFRQLRASDTDIERTIGVYILTPLLMLLAWLLHKGWLWPCWFRQQTGIPCPTCGAVHAWTLLVSCHPLQALRSQPLMTLIEVGAVIFIVYSWLAVIFKTRRIRFENVHPLILAAWSGVLILLNWMYLLRRMR